MRSSLLFAATALMNTKDIGCRGPEKFRAPKRNRSPMVADVGKMEAGGDVCAAGAVNGRAEQRRSRLT